MLPTVTTTSTTFLLLRPAHRINKNKLFASDDDSEREKRHHCKKYSILFYVYTPATVDWCQLYKQLADVDYHSLFCSLSFSVASRAKGSTQFMAKYIRIRFFFFAHVCIECHRRPYVHIKGYTRKKNERKNSVAINKELCYSYTKRRRATLCLSRLSLGGASCW